MNCHLILTFRRCSFLLTMTTVICWSMNTRMVAKSAGPKANRAVHQGFASKGSMTQPRPLHVGWRVPGTSSFGVSTPEKE